MMGRIRDGHELRAIASFKSSWADPSHSLTFRITTTYVGEIDGNSIRAEPFGPSSIKAHQLLMERRSDDE